MTRILFLVMGIVFGSALIGVGFSIAHIDAAFSKVYR